MHRKFYFQFFLGLNAIITTEIQWNPPCSICNQRGLINKIIRGKWLSLFAEKKTMKRMVSCFEKENTRPQLDLIQLTQLPKRTGWPQKSSKLIVSFWTLLWVRWRTITQTVWTELILNWVFHSSLYIQFFDLHFDTSNSPNMKKTSKKPNLNKISLRINK